MRDTDDVHWRVLRIIEGRPDITQRELAEQLGVSLGKVNYLIRALLAKGAIKAKNFKNSRSKLAYVYLLTPRGISQKSAMTHDYLRRKLLEYEALRTEIELLQRETEVRGPLR